MARQKYYQAILDQRVSLNSCQLPFSPHNWFPVPVSYHLFSVKFNLLSLARLPLFCCPGTILTICSQYDPWLTSTVSSEFRPGGPLKSTPEAPIAIIPGGYHCSDFRTSNGAANAGVQAVIDREVGQIVEWVGEWQKK
jgi:hypothetical protein